MQTTQHTQDNAVKFTARIISGIRTLFGVHEGGCDSLVATCASDILRVKGLEQWIESTAALTHRERTEMLLRASATFRSELMAADISNTLSCMATDAGLFLAVTDALKKSNHRNVQFAQAA